MILDGGDPDDALLALLDENGQPIDGLENDDVPSADAGKTTPDACEPLI